MRCLLSPRDYDSLDRFVQEREILFARVWLFAGLTRSLSDDRDFVLARAGHESVVVQNFSGELRAFSNVCAHRHAPLRTCREGNGLLRCPYHGWTYDESGAPYAVPHRGAFDAAELASARLRPWRVETCGEFVFVSKSASTPPLQEYLGPLYAELAELSGALGAVVDRNDFEVQANWKLWIENSVEGYHVQHVHSTSIGVVTPSERDRNVFGDHSTVLSPIAETESSRKILRQALAARVFDRDEYRHYFVFPNLCITSTRGLVFDVIVSSPLSPEKTGVESTLWSSKFEGKVARSVLDEFYSLAREFARTVQAEDRAIVEVVAQGVREAEGPGLLGALENRIENFQESYSRWMSGPLRAGR